MDGRKAWERLERRDGDDRRGVQRSFAGHDRRSGIDRRHDPDAWKDYWKEHGNESGASA